MLQICYRVIDELLELEHIGRTEMEEAATTNIKGFLQSWQLCTCHSDLSNHVDDIEKKAADFKVHLVVLSGVSIVWLRTSTETWGKAKRHASHPHLLTAQKWSF